MAAATIGLAAPAKADDGGKHAGLLGAWMITRRDDSDGSTATGVASFATGGIALYQDMNRPAQPSPERSSRTTENSGRRSSPAPKPTKYSPGSPALTQEVHTHGTRDNDPISGTYQGTATDATNGDPVGLPVTGTFTGTRIIA